MNQEITRDEEDRRYLVVRSGSLRCAVPAADVVRVVRGLACHPVPGADAHLLGLAQYGGEPLPVLDLHTVVEGGASGSRHHSTVILGRGRRRDLSVIGLAVDEVVRVVGIGQCDAADGGDPVAPTVMIDGERVKVLDTGRFLGTRSDGPGALDG